MQSTNFGTLIRSLRTSSSHADLAEFAKYVKEFEVSDVEVSELARVLAESGETLLFASQSATADFSSTGGPSSLSTLICPLVLSCLGATVPTLGVAGRPAGGIDALCQIPGFDPEPEKSRMTAVLNDRGHIHVLASDKYAPLDALLFSVRQEVGAQAVPALVIASLLSKKLCMGVRNVGLEVRVSPFGNFGSTRESALNNSERFCRVSTLLGLNATCFITDGTRPYQNYIGRKEALVALHKVLEGTADGTLREHLSMCIAMAFNTVGISDLQQVTLASLRAELVALLKAHGSSIAAFESVVSETRLNPRVTIVADHTGFFNVNLNELRSVIVSCQKATPQANQRFADPVGVVLAIGHDSFVETGADLAYVRIDSGDQEAILSGLRRALSVSNTVGPSVLQMVKV